MIRDYKFDSSFVDHSRRRRNRRRLLLGLATLGLIGGGIVLYPQLGTLLENTTAESNTLALPVATEPSPVATPSKATVISAPLALPTQNTAPAPSATKSLLQQPGTQLSLPPAQSSKPVAKAPAAEKKTLISEPSPSQMSPSWVEHTVGKGESLSKIFKQHGLSASVLHKIVNASKEAKQLARIRPGQTLRFLLDDDGKLDELRFEKSKIETLHVYNHNDGIKTELQSKAVETRIATAAGTIQSSLFLDAQKAGLSDKQIMELSALFNWDIDFALEIRAGDEFRILYEEHYLDGKKWRDGPILAAAFTNKGTTYQAFRYEDNKGDAGYYDKDGRSKRRAFIRTPIKFARVSSRFNPRRLHPVLKVRRPHKGVDYAAPIGTPIKVTGAGKVTYRGWKGGYGRVVIVQHGPKYSTLYAHMSKFSSKVKSGKRVKQGQIIGYVGKSGRVTGAHLHYEFRVNGVHRNPLTVKLPKSVPLPKNQLAKFKKHTGPLVAQLAAIKPATMLASSEQ